MNDINQHHAQLKKAAQYAGLFLAVALLSVSSFFVLVLIHVLEYFGIL